MISKDEIERELYLSRERRLADELSLQDYADNAREYGIAEGKELGIAEGKELGIAEGKELGKEIGHDEGELIGIIRTCEQFLGIPVTSREELYGVQIEDLKARASGLQSELGKQQKKMK